MYDSCINVSWAAWAEWWNGKIVRGSILSQKYVRYLIAFSSWCWLTSLIKSLILKVGVDQQVVGELINSKFSRSALGSPQLLRNSIFLQGHSEIENFLWVEASLAWHVAVLNLFVKNRENRKTESLRCPFFFLNGSTEKLNSLQVFLTVLAKGYLAISKQFTSMENSLCPCQRCSSVIVIHIGKGCRSYECSSQAICQRLTATSGTRVSKKTHWQKACAILTLLSGDIISTNVTIAPTIDRYRSLIVKKKSCLKCF